MSTKPENYLESPPEDVEFSEEEWLNMSYDMQYYYANESVRKSTREREKRSRNWFRDLKSQTGCRVCEESVPEALVFHHIGEKSFAITNHQAGRSEESLKEEMSKCVLLCANCHRKHHADKLNLDVSSLERSVEYTPIEEWE